MPSCGFPGLACVCCFLLDYTGLRDKCSFSGDFVIGYFVIRDGGCEVCGFWFVDGWVFVVCICAGG